MVVLDDVAAPVIAEAAKAQGVLVSQVSARRIRLVTAPRRRPGRGRARRRRAERSCSTAERCARVRTFPLRNCASAPIGGPRPQISPTPPPRAAACQAEEVARDPRQLVGEAGGSTVPELLAEVSRSTLRNWVAAGKLVRLRPGRVRATGRRAELADPGGRRPRRTRGRRQSRDRPGPLGARCPTSGPGPRAPSIPGGAAGVRREWSCTGRPTRTRNDAGSTGLAVSSAERALVDAWTTAGRRNVRRSGRRRSPASAAGSARRANCGTR